MNEREKQFSFTRAALSTGGRAKSKFLSLLALVIIPGAAGARPDTDVPPEPPFFYYYRGLSALDKGKNQVGAIADFTKAIELSPDYAEAYAARARTKLLKFDKWKYDADGALADYTKAIELNPENWEYYGSRAYLKRLKGDVDGAIADFTKARELPRYGGSDIDRVFVGYNEELKQLILLRQHFIAQGQAVLNTQRPELPEWPYRAYIGPALPADQVAVLTFSAEQFSLLSIDGYRINHNWDGSLFRKTDKKRPPGWEVELLPGHHTLSFYPYSFFHKRGLVGTSVHPIDKEIDVKAGKTYRARMMTQNGGVTGYGRTGNSVTTYSEVWWDVVISEDN